MKLDFAKIEKKWQDRWSKAGIFKVREDPKKRKYYVLEMFPYPSAAGLHMGHIRNYAMGDTVARYKRMQGFNVLYPMGYDAFGLPAENAAIKSKTHPKKYTEKAIAGIKKNQKALGLSYDWSREIATCYPEYYRWNQWFFVQMLKRGLAYRKKAPVNWCPRCNTVLANEQVEGGKCWRCGSGVEIRNLEQWFLRITKYADRLLHGLKKIDWPENVKKMQENWIGRSEGTRIYFRIKDSEKTLSVFTTRPDTLFGITFMVYAPEHPDVLELVKGTKYEKRVKRFINKVVLKEKFERTSEESEKEGMFIGRHVIHPVTGDELPIYIANFVLLEYGTGAIIAVPAHDQRDFMFAKKYGIDMKTVIVPSSDNLSRAKKSLKELKRIKEAADKAGIKFWLLGGLAHAFHVGHVYRENNDLDLIVKEPGQQEKFMKVLESLGFRKKSEKKLTGSLLVYTYKNGRGMEVDTGPYAGEFGLKDSDFEEDERELEGVRCLTLSKRYLIEFKKGMMKKRNEEKDRLDLEYLESPQCYTGPGKMVNSQQFDGMGNVDAMDGITRFLEKKKAGKAVVEYKLRDWLISRQRYWGTPIPVVYCDKCGMQSVPEKDLPVLLPTNVKFKGEGNPLKKSENFLNSECPLCKGHARRETDTMDTFVDSSWYFLRYCSPRDKKSAFDRKAVKYWMPVDQYIGGVEHAVMHLMYARFFNMVLKDIGLLNFEEPFLRLFNQGIVYKDGHKMSKSFGNVVTQEEMSKKYGIDTARVFLLFVASPESQLEWSEEGVQGAHRFLSRLYRLVHDNAGKVSFGRYRAKCTRDRILEAKLALTARRVSEHIEGFQFNLAISSVMDFVSHLQAYAASPEVNGHLFGECLKVLIQLISPFAPHIAEELWEMVGMKGLVSATEWPDTGKVDENVIGIENIINQLGTDMEQVIRLAKVKPRNIRLVVAAGWKYPFLLKLKREMKKSRNPGDVMHGLMSDKALKPHAKDLGRLVPHLLKNQEKIPPVVLSAKEEQAVLNELKASLEEQFGCKVSVEPAEKSKSPKSAQAMPGKPGIEVS
jgi:leucyl-tRNA synthetase